MASMSGPKIAPRSCSRLAAFRPAAPSGSIAPAAGRPLALTQTVRSVPPCGQPPRRRQQQQRHSVAASASAEAAVTAEIGDYVECSYSVQLEDGTVVDSSDAAGEHACFILGGGRVVAGFHQAVGGLAVGESRKMPVAPEDAYGERQDDMVAQVPKSQAPKGLKPGSVVQLTNGMQAVVTAVDEESVSIDANHPLAGKQLSFEVQLTRHIPAAQLEYATFGAGCFWSVELVFQRVPGVLQTAVGYSQGRTPSPTYEDVCQGNTGHNEVVQLVYDPSEVSYEQLLDVFWGKHDPTTLNSQGGDSGEQYRSGIYFHTEAQRKVAEASLAAQNEKLGGRVVTEIQKVDNYSEAEEYHQRYLERGGRFGQPQSAAKRCDDPIRCYG